MSPTYYSNRRKQAAEERDDAIDAAEARYEAAIAEIDAEEEAERSAVDDDA